MSYNVLPTGLILPFAGSNPPTGFLNCDGSPVSRTTYAALFEVIGTNYGNGDGSTTFNVPDYRYQFLRGNGPNLLASGSGTASSNNATFTDHRFNRTGMRVRLLSGSLSGLTTGVDYFVIVINSNTLAFATTYGNAMAGTKISISGANTANINQWEDPDSTIRLSSSVGGLTGDNVGTRQDDAFQSHRHNGRMGVNGGTLDASRVSGVQSNAAVTDTATFVTNPTVDGSFGTPRASFETRPKNVSANFIIKV